MMRGADLSNAQVRLDRRGPVPSLRLSLLEQSAGLRHAFTTRLGGHSEVPFATLNLGLSVGDDPSAVLANRALATRLVGGAGQPATVRQVHGVTSLRADAPARVAGEPLGETDMIATCTPGLALLVQAADCAPIVIHDPVHCAAAVVHAGWRGVAANAGGAAVASMARLFGSKPGDLLVGIGPAIGVCCYEVGDEVANAVDRAAGKLVSRSGPRGILHTDLVAALRAQFTCAGTPASNIADTGLCTACRTDLFYSHRREGEPTGRFGVVAALS
jgi:YfiH family protein